MNLSETNEFVIQFGSESHVSFGVSGNLFHTLGNIPAVFINKV